MFSCLITLLCISTLRCGTVSKYAAFMPLREFKLMPVGSSTCSRCKQAFETVSCVPCDWGIGRTKIRGPGSALYETVTLTMFHSAGYCTSKVCGMRRRLNIFKVLGRYGVRPYVFCSLLLLKGFLFSKIIKICPSLILIHGRFVIPSSVNSQTLWGSNKWTCGNILFKAYQA
jgi:hypothetical protein